MQFEISAHPHYRWLIFSVAALGTFMSTLDSSIVNVALPTIAENLKADVPTVQWVVSAYLLAICSCLPLFGRVGDIYGRRLIYKIGFTVFTIGSVLCGAANSIWLLVAARVVQAIGAAMLMSNSPAIITLTFPGAERGRALGMNGTIVALGSLVGPSIGGVLVGMIGWKFIFYVNIPIGIIGYIGAHIILPKDTDHHKEELDIPGAVLFAIGMISFLMLLSHGRDWGWDSATVKICAVLAIIAFSVFVWREQRVRHPMIDLTMFQNWPFLAGNISGLLAFMAMFSNTILLPFYLSSLLKLSPTQIGLLMTPFPMVMAVVAPVSGYLSERISQVVLTTTGLVITTAGLIYMAQLDLASTMLEIAIGQAVLGFGNGIFQSPNNNNVMSSVHPSKVGIASGISALVRNVGMVSGTAIAVSIFENRRHYALDGMSMPSVGEEAIAFLSGYHWALIVGACFAAIGAIISLNRKGHLKVG